jgi:hypothetical protein
MVATCLNACCILPSAASLDELFNERELRVLSSLKAADHNVLPAAAPPSKNLLCRAYDWYLSWAVPGKRAAGAADAPPKIWLACCSPRVPWLTNPSTKLPETPADGSGMLRCRRRHVF